ncbi:uncharacterized protein PV09_08769 [Verruconis gallopava]|uniref:Uncharacterized protein n=1 Tax=Verruconis gallopava TaxID=253628 RepID=A0A0D2AKQ8_9PEZI|nr:uncharacterized protein PV09_08769 [Verruconis gallopava]KIV99593.1 hypothetical protein PV09_08769 [Verruconis gallopava]
MTDESGGMQQRISACSDDGESGAFSALLARALLLRLTNGTSERYLLTLSNMKCEEYVVEKDKKQGEAKATMGMMKRHNQTMEKKLSNRFSAQSGRGHARRS